MFSDMDFVATIAEGVVLFEDGHILPMMQGK